MKCKYKIICIIIMLVQYLLINSVMAIVVPCNTIAVTMNRMTQATIAIDCNIVPVYVIFYLHNPERIVIDFLKDCKFRKSVLPMNFNGNNLIKCVRASTPIQPRSVRIVIDLTHTSMIEIVTQKKIDKIYRLMFTICQKKVPVISSDMQIGDKSPILCSKLRTISAHRDRLSAKSKNIARNILFHNNHQQHQEIKKSSLIIVAIDAGHGGQDPGATGYTGIYEKDITISISRKLKRLLDLDPMFSAVMIRNGDYFLSVMERSDIARKKRADVLISIHADSAMNTNVRGASVWILSHNRAKSEMISLLNRSEKYSELLGGIGEILTSYHYDLNFNHFILDLQFGYSQKVGYKIATHVLCQLKDVSVLHKNIPEYSSFGILRAPDIPSILVETGFISNKKEVHLLSSSEYQEKIANALYKGLRTYFIVDKPEKLIHHNSCSKNHIVVIS